MAINQRELSRAINRQALQFTEISVLATGTTNIVAVIPYNAAIDALGVATQGLSGSPVGSLSAYRSISGGITQIPLGVTIPFQLLGTSGVLGVSVLPSGVSLMAGDSVVMLMAGANSAVAGVLMQFVVRGLDDVRNYQFIPVS